MSSVMFLFTTFVTADLENVRAVMSNRFPQGHTDKTVSLLCVM